MKNPKIIALYLPQFHSIPENDQFWGKGFTDWVSVKKAKPLYKEHNQPMIPLNENYYDLSKEESVEWQINLANENGIYGFGIYHYWFNNEKNLLTKPAEIIRDSKNNKVKYFLIWDNNSWVRSWSNIPGNSWAPAEESKIDSRTGKCILIEHILGKEEDWKKHYNYIRTHFLSTNYEKLNNKPVFSIISYNPEINKMCQYWNELAKEDGFAGIHVIYQNNKNILGNSEYKYTYQPHWSGWQNRNIWKKIINKLSKIIRINKKINSTILDYDDVWKKIIKHSKKCNKPYIYHGAFVGYDDSPRRGKKNAIIIKGRTPQKFKQYFKEIFLISKSQNKEYIFLTAWNEWGEGAFLEPDTTNKTEFLTAIKETLIESQSII